MTDLFHYIERHVVKPCYSANNAFGKSINKSAKAFIDILKKEEIITGKTKSISLASVSYEYRRL